MSPKIQNALIGDTNAVYIPIEPDNFHNVIVALKSIKNFMGANVTIPYKESIIPYLDEISDDAAFCGAVNTIYKVGGKWFGANSDISGFSDALKYDLKFDSEGKDIVLLGAGGAARAVVTAIGDNAASITIINRSPKNAEKLAELFSGKLKCRFKIKEWGENFKADLIVNATPIGLNGDMLPIGLKNASLFDLVYSEIDTPIVALYRSHNKPAIDGKQMLYRQAKASFTIWKGTK